MKIELSKSQLDAVASAKIEALEREVKSLKSRLASRDRALQVSREGLDLTKERRAKIKDLAATLVDELLDAGWIDYDERC